MIPNFLHFVFGMSPDFGGKPFSLVHYLSIRSAAELNQPDKIYFHYAFEPLGEWWDKIKPLLTLNKIESPNEFMGTRLYHVAHKADVVRLQSLSKWGGVYMDLDTISVKPLSPLFKYSFAIGEELKAGYLPKNARQRFKYDLKKSLGLVKKRETVSTGLCNAVLLAEPGSFFINKWLDSYSSFRSKGRDEYWNEHSVQVPEKLASLYPENITRLSPYAFHFPLFDEEGLRSMFESVNEFPEAYVHHLWESFSWDKYLSKLTVESILNKDTSYNLIARKYLAS